MGHKLKIAVLATIVSWLTLGTLGIWTKVLLMKYDAFFVEYMNIIFIVSSILLFIFIIISLISIRLLVKNNIAGIPSAIK